MRKTRSEGSIEVVKIGELRQRGAMDSPLDLVLCRLL